MGVVEMHCRSCCVRLKADGGLSSGLVSRIQLGDGCVVYVLGLFFTVFR
jgi:hypothetical protein